MTYEMLQEIYSSYVNEYITYSVKSTYQTAKLCRFLNSVFKRALLNNELSALTHRFIKYSTIISRALNIKNLVLIPEAQTETRNDYAVTDTGIVVGAPTGQ